VLAYNIILGQETILLSVTPNEIEISIDHKITVSTKLNNTTINDLKLIKKVKIKKPLDALSHLENTKKKKEIISDKITFEFAHADFLGHPVIILTTLHHFEKAISFKAKIKIKDREDYIETSILTKHPNVISIEQWKDDIESIILYDFKLEEDNNSKDAPRVIHRSN